MQIGSTLVAALVVLPSLVVAVPPSLNALSALRRRKDGPPSPLRLVRRDEETPRERRKREMAIFIAETEPAFRK
ncbi:hypothetical protein ACRALDRAFT_1075304 [Sodiomyces alcalophilus JCM 7366]|uniref:uncharacterized protein n=1 Tax=Sodiomyces alcalophilus JCM 7366 TaxID=591952 RepID=UPI0039B6296F